MSNDTLSLETIREEAARWAMRLNDGDLSEEQREAFQRWLLADPQHGDEFRAHNSIVALAGELPLDLHARLVTLVKEDAAAVEAPAPRARRWMPAFAVAAAVLVLVAAGWFVARPVQQVYEPYVTHTGEVRSVTFEDGSVAYLNTRTRVQWIGNADDRRVALLEGEALFDVMHDETRPFRVVLDNSEIQVLGTRFNVYRKTNGEVVVTVLEGSVKVREQEKTQSDGSAHTAWERELHANQRIAYRSIGLISDVHNTTALNAVKWREGVLELEDEPLPNVLDELTRYTDQRILIRDSRLAQLRLGGALSVRDVRAALARIEKLAPVAVTENNGTFTLDYRSAETEERL